ncbi:MAG: class I SAM-dependent methyltransferase [Actinobacteria bacterium]|nr:class I SAM-dependent methyltransferase [Actinomycetota bacterium]
MKIIDILKLNLPFSYMGVLRNSIGNPKTVLDLGCGEGTLMQFISDGKNWQITGIEIYKKAIDVARKRNAYYKLIQGDLLKTIKNNLKSKYDVVFFSQVIEHVTRSQGEKILDEIEKLAKKRIIVGTPRGFMEQPHEFLDGNPHQVHKSGWSIEDFASRGYKVYGIGFWPIWSHHGLGRNASFFTMILSNVISYLMSPIVYFFPVLGAGIIAIKNKEKKND